MTVLIAVLFHLCWIHARQTWVPCLFHQPSPCRNDAPCTHTQAICWWTCSRCCTHAVEKFESLFSKLRSWAITITVIWFPSQQALQKSYKSHRTTPSQISHCATCAFLFENVMLCLISSYLSNAPIWGVVTHGFIFKKPPSLSTLNLQFGKDSRLTGEKMASPTASCQYTSTHKCRR